MMDGRLLNERNKSSASDIIFWIVMALMGIFILFSLYFRATYMLVRVKGESMLSTLFDDDVLLANKSEQTKRGDIVVIDVRDFKGTDHEFKGNYIIKRAIALEGDKIYCKGNTVYVCYAGAEDFVALDEGYVSDRSGNYNFSVVTVGAGEVFVMGDNRGNSTDSRDAGCFKLEYVAGVIPDWSYENRAQIKAWLGHLIPEDPED